MADFETVLVTGGSGYGGELLHRPTPERGRSRADDRAQPRA